MKHTAAAVLFVSTTFFGAPLFAGDALSIRDIARDGAVLVVGADDFRGTLDRLGPTAYGKLWNDPESAELVRTIKENFEKTIADAAAQSGIDRADITWPSSLGLALMVEMDEEMGIPSPEFVFFCDWSAEAEKAGAFVDALVADIEKKAKDGGATVKVEEIRGRRAIGLPTGGAGAAADGEDGNEFEDEFADEFGGGLGDIGPSEIFVVSDKGRLLAASSVEAMDGLLVRVDGDRAKSVGETENFRRATDLAGGTQDIYAVLSTEAAGPLLGAFPELMLVQPLVARLFGDIKAWSFGMHAKDGVLETAQGILVPDGKVGLLSLVDLATEPKAPPAIVPADALSYGRLNVRFDRVLPMLDEVLGGLPPEQADMIRPQIDLYRPAMQAAFAAMGPEVHLWSVETDPADIAASGTVTAISMKNDKDSARAVVDFINLLPLGLQSRDFNGMTILSDEFAPFAVGIGGGALVLGSVEHVEQALRAVDAKAGEGLAGEASFKKALAGMSTSPVVGMAWWDTVRQLESTARTMNTMMDGLGGMVNLDDEAIPGVELSLDDVMGFWKLMSNKELVKRCFGDSLLDFTASDAGFTTSYRMLPGAAE